MMKMKYIRKGEAVEICKLSIYFIPFLHCDKRSLVIKVTYTLRWWKWSILKRETLETCKLNIYVVPLLHCDKSVLVIQLTHILGWWKWSTLERERQ